MESLGDQKAVSGNAQGGVVVKPQPSSSFVMPQAKFLLQFLIVAFDTPAHLGDEYKLLQRRIAGHRR